MAAIIQIVQGTNTVAIAATQSGSCLISVQVANDHTADISVTSDNQGNLWVDGDPTFSESAGTQTEINWSYRSSLGGTHPPAAGVTSVSGVGTPPGTVYMWVFEIGSPVFSTDPVGGPCFSITPQDDSIQASSGFSGIPSSASPSLDDTGTACALWFGTAAGCPDWELVIAVCGAGGDGGNITGVQSPWTMAGTPQGGNVCAYRFIPSGSNPCPMVFNAAAPTVSTISVAGFYSYADTPPVPGHIIIAKATVPSGSPAIFKFTPSFGAPFTLTDGHSHDSGPLTAGTYSIVETPVAGWDTSVSQNPASIVVTDGVTVTVTFTNTPTAGGFAWGPSTVVPWLLSIEDHMLTINDLDGDADLADLIFNVQDRTQLITADFPGFVFEGKRMRLLAGFDGMARSDFVTLFTGRVDSIESANANMEYVFTNPDVRQELTRTIYTVADDGFPTDSSHVRTLNGNPLDILIAALENEVGLAPGDIDIAKILSYRNSVYNGVQMEFKITTPPVAKNFIADELMKPLAAYIWPNNLGQVSVNFYYPLSPLPVFDFNRDNLIEIPEAGPADLINEVSVRLDYDSSDSPKAIIVREDAASVAKFGLYGNHIIEAKGLRSGLQGAFLGALAAWLIFLRYSFKQLMFGSSNSGNGNANPINALWSACLVEPGDIVTLTHPQVPDRNAGVMGVTGKTFVAMDRQWQFFPCLTQLKLLETDLSKFKQYLIAPNGEAVYTAAGTDQGKYMFLCNDSDQYSNGDPGNTLA